MEEAYAQALWKMVEEGMKPKEAVASIHASLVSRGREALLPRIAHAFARLAAKKRQATGVTLTVAREKDARKAEHAAQELLQELEIRTSDVTFAVDDSLIGGWRLEGKEMLVDASFKRDLLDMYKAITNELPRPCGVGV